jgi:micrococcal nuclease
MYDYYCIIVRVIDGDTVDVDIDLGFGIILKNRRVRIIGIDAPPTRTKDLVEKQFGLASLRRAEELLPVSSKQILFSKLDRNGDVAHGKFGRILGDFQIGKSTFSKIMLDEGQAVPYNGGSKDELTVIMMANRERLLTEGTVVLDPDFK